MRTPIPASQLAFQLQHEFIANIDQEVAANLNIDPARLREYERKVLLYRMAIVMFVLYQEASEFPQYGKVLQELEKLVFHTGPTEESWITLASIKSAVSDVEGLVSSGKTWSWSRAWLQEVGVDESNPVTLLHFGTFWMDFLATSQKAIREFDPL